MLYYFHNKINICSAYLWKISLEKLQLRNTVPSSLTGGPGIMYIFRVEKKICMKMHYASRKSVYLQEISFRKSIKGNVLYITAFYPELYEKCKILRRFSFQVKKKSEKI